MTTTEPKTQADRLNEPFAPEQLRHHRAKNLTYVPISEVEARLNRVLGHGNWEKEIVRLWEAGDVTTDTGVYPKWIMAHVRLEGVLEDGRRFSYDGVGGQEVQFLRPKNKDNAVPGPVDLGDNYKGAVSDATKKAAQSLGIGLDLAREDDAIAAERAAIEAEEQARALAERMEAEAREPKATQDVTDKIARHASALPKNSPERAAFVAWWAERTNRKKLAPFEGTVTVREADEAMEHLGITMESPDPEPTNAPQA